MISTAGLAASPIPSVSEAPLRAVHTPNFPGLLRQLGASLLVTTYQAGKLVMVRDEGDHLNTHFRGFPAPMGMALAGDRLAVGTKIQVWEFVDVPAVARRLNCKDEGGRKKDQEGMARSSDSSLIPHPSTTPASCRGPATSRATSRSMR